MFINPLLLYGLPLALLPILIHLINRQRHRTVPWAAMMFLLDAKRLQRSMAKVRYWLILAMRTLAIIALFFAASRPLASGWLGSRVGSSADTVLLLLDRSPSMEQTDPDTQRSKRAAALDRFSDLMKTTGEGKRLVLIESTRETPEEVDPKQLSELPITQASDTTANLPSMLETAVKYLKSNEVAQADIWIASDLRDSDWQQEDGRWAAIREQLAALPAVKIQLVSYATPAQENRSIRVLRARRRLNNDVAEVRVEFTVTGSVEEEAPLSVEFELNGITSVVQVDSSSNGQNQIEHVIPIDPGQTHGWGKVQLPADRNNADNAAYFVFGPEPPRHTVIVAEDPKLARPLRLASAAGVEPNLEFSATVVPTNRVAEIDWESTSFLIWHAPLPKGTAAKQLTAHLNKGRPVLCLPPAASVATDSATKQTTFAGMRWAEWTEVTKTEPVGIGYWDNESDILAKAQSGDALPVGKQVTKKYRKLEGNGRRLAKFTNDADLLVKPQANLPLYFLTTLPRADYSSLAEDGVVLYAMVQRAIELGASQQASTQAKTTGFEKSQDTSDATSGIVSENEDGAPDSLPDSLTRQTLLSSLPEQVVSADVSHFAGCHQTANNWVSLNRAVSEDDTRTLESKSLEQLFEGLEFQAIEDASGSDSALVNEIWRLFLIGMAIALILEAVLCL